MTERRCAAKAGPRGGEPYPGPGARIVLACAEAAAPRAAARLVAAKARRVPARVRAVPAYPGAEITALDMPGGVTESVGDGPGVFLLPGYHGAGHLNDFVPALAGAGYQAITVRVPGHCPDKNDPCATREAPASRRLRRRPAPPGFAAARWAKPQGDGEGSNSAGSYVRGILPEFTGALKAAAAVHGDPFAVIGHCLGSYAAQLAVLDGLRATRALVLIEALPDAAAVADVISRHLGLRDRTRALLPAVLARQAGLTLAEADAAARAREAAFPDKVLVIWDDSSQVIPAAHSIALAGAWAAALHRTEDLGHFRVLRSAPVHATVIAHLDAARNGGRPEREPGISGQVRGGMCAARGGRDHGDE